MPAPPPPGGQLEVSRDDEVWTLRIANPDRANALDGAILDALVDTLEGAAAARVVLLAGAGDRHFSAGLDLADRGPEELAGDIADGERRLGRAARAIAECARPVICVINGAVFGGALELAIACDWRVAVRGARLGMPAARIGVVYAADGLRRFVAALGPARARRIFLTGQPLDAQEAYELGLVDQLASHDDLWDVAYAAARDVAGAAPLAVAGTRAIVRAIEEGDPEGSERLAELWRARAFASADLREGLAAFRGKRPPEFREQ